MLFVPTPTDAYPDETVRCSFEGQSYAIRWLWNERDGAWVFSLSDNEGLVVSGVRVALNVDLLRTVPMSPRRPPGKMYVIDPSGSTVEPDLESLGKSVKVVYVPEAEL